MGALFRRLRQNIWRSIVAGSLSKVPLRAYQFRSLAFFALLFLAFELPSSVHAQASADKQQPLRIVVPYPPGGGIDYLARQVAPRLRDKLGQNVIVENRPGATGMIAASAVAHTLPADGNTLLFGNLAIFVVNPLLSQTITYDVGRDFVPVGKAGTFEFILVVNPKVLPAQNLGDLLSAAKQAPKGLNYASSGIGAVPHLLMEMLAKQTNINLVPVHYKGGSPALQDLISGQIGTMFLDYSTARVHVDSGRLRAIAVAADRRIEALPNVPTLGELGVKHVNAGGWVGMVVRTGTPIAAVKRINDAYAEAIQSPDIRGRLVDAGFSPASSTGEEFRRFIANESRHWSEVIRERGIKSE